MQDTRLSDHEPAVRDFFGLLWRYFGARVDHDIEDLIQQTLIEYLEAAGKVAPVRHPKGYVLRVARSVLFGYYQRRRNFDPLSDSVADMSRGLSSRLADQQRTDRLKTAMRELPYTLYEVIDLYYGEGLRGPVLAEALGVPEGTVRSRLRRAKTQLRAACSEVG